MIKDECQIEVRESEFEIYECEESNRAKIKDINSVDCNIDTFKCKNNTDESIIFVIVDKCQFSDSDSFEKCDFLLINSKEISFVELKIDVKPKNRKRHRDKAISQLKSTLERLSDLSKDKDKSCYICFGKTATKAPNASLKSKEVQFYNETGAKLYIECNKIFEN